MIPCPKSLWQHRTIWQEAPARIFGSIQSLENEGILYVFLVFQAEEVGQKDGCGSQAQLRGVALKKLFRFPLFCVYKGEDTKRR